MPDRMHPCVWFYFFPIASFLVPVILCIYNYEDFEAPLSAGIGEALCSAEIADETFSVRSKIQCAMLCYRKAFCMEFNFRMDTKSCEFYYCRASHVLQRTLHCSNYQVGQPCETIADVTILMSLTVKCFAQ